MNNQEERKEPNDIDVIIRCINELDKINIPALFVRQIGIPVSNVSGELRLLVDRVVGRNKVKEEEPSDEEEFHVSISEPIVSDTPPEGAEPVQFPG